MTSIQKKIEIIESRIQRALGILRECTLCPRRCEVDRTAGEKGICKAGENPIVSTASLHHGEEPPISGWRGSGTIFFSSCNLRCVFCQNYPISHYMQGDEISTEQLANAMIALQKRNAHNINWVTPTHFSPQIMAALLIAYKKGLTIPVVYNCGGYESLEMLQLWDGIIDIYMPDMKYSDSTVAKKYSAAPDYPEVNRQSIREMHRQVGDLQIGQNGIAQQGLLVRHLVLPNNLAGTEEILKFIATEISKNTYISLMSQYFPDYKADSIPELSRRITAEEYNYARNLMEKYDLHCGWHQNAPIDSSIFNIRRFLKGDF